MMASLLQRLFAGCEAGLKPAVTTVDELAGDLQHIKSFFILAVEELSDEEIFELLSFHCHIRGYDLGPLVVIDTAKARELSYQGPDGHVTRGAMLLAGRDIKDISTDALRRLQIKYDFVLIGIKSPRGRLPRSELGRLVDLSDMLESFAAVFLFSYWDTYLHTLGGTPHFKEHAEELMKKILGVSLQDVLNAQSRWRLLP